MWNTGQPEKCSFEGKSLKDPEEWAFLRKILKKSGSKSADDVLY